MPIREMSEKQFRTAAERNGFRLDLGCWLTDSELGISYGLIFTQGKRGALTMHYRQSLARAIQKRTKDKKEREAK